MPFVSMFCGMSTYLWEDEGTTHNIVQGEGGEQGDAMMPSSSLSVNTPHLKKCRPNCFLVRSCSLCDVLERMLASQTQQRAFGECQKSSRQGIKVLGTPLVHQDFVRTHFWRAQQPDQWTGFRSWVI